MSCARAAKNYLWSDNLNGARGAGLRRQNLPNMDREQLISDLKNKIVAALNLHGVSPDDIGTDAPLFGDEGLGLDSVDALELVVMVEREYGIVVDESDNRGENFSSVAALADYIESKKGK